MAGCFTVGLNLRCPVGRRQPGPQWMLRGDHHAGHTVERVGTGGVDPQHIVRGLLGKAGCGPVLLPDCEASGVIAGGGQKEVDLRPGAAADPVPLKLFDACRPVEAVEFPLQPVSIGGNP